MQQTMNEELQQRKKRPQIDKFYAICKTSILARHSFVASLGFWVLHHHPTTTEADYTEEIHRHPLFTCSSWWFPAISYNSPGVFASSTRLYNHQRSFIRDEANPQLPKPHVSESRLSLPTRNHSSVAGGYPFKSPPLDANLIDSRRKLITHQNNVNKWAN